MDYESSFMNIIIINKNQYRYVSILYAMKAMKSMQDKYQVAKYFE